jgi:hypothetical protein
MRYLCLGHVLGPELEADGHALLLPVVVPGRRLRVWGGGFRV